VEKSIYLKHIFFVIIYCHSLTFNASLLNKSSNSSLSLSPKNKKTFEQQCMQCAFIMPQKGAH